MLIISQINIYPIKSLDGYSVKSSVVEPKGLRYDRRWMLVDENGVFLSQRNCRKMTGLRALVEGDFLHIRSKTDQKHNIKLEIDDSAQLVKVQIWDDEVEALTVNAAADAFLSDFLNLKCHLVKMPDNGDRQIDMSYAKSGETVSFADGFPFLIIGEASFEDLNGRLIEKLAEPSRRFRPNFVFSGGMPYVEDTWKELKIGNVLFSGRKNCGRCVMITLDPDSGEANNEPLSTLSGYRKRGNSVVFGQNLCLDPANSSSQIPLKVSVGDSVDIPVSR